MSDRYQEAARSHPPNGAYHSDLPLRDDAVPVPSRARRRGFNVVLGDGRRDTATDDVSGDGRERLPIHRGRGASDGPANRFVRRQVELDVEEEAARRRAQVPTEVVHDETRTALSTNDSPDLPFRYSVNPYRGCEHGCPYCYARPGHEYLGYSPGLDFETRIVAKPQVPDRLAETFQRRSWEPDVVVLSGATDPYQPVERRLEITRRLLRVFAAHRNPVAVITKNALVSRDLDLLAALATYGAVHVTISVTTLRPELARAMEPRASAPSARLEAIRRLAEAGVPVGVNVAPVIPGLTDEEVPGIVAAAAEAGAERASHIVVRLPGPVAPIFEAWLRAHTPGRADKVLNRIRSMRGGRLNDPRFGRRMAAGGAWGAVVGQTFRAACVRHRLSVGFPDLRTDAFRRLPGGQRGLFDA